jgi:pimeloyl-ACP methyl ester carboxylesterase
VRPPVALQTIADAGHLANMEQPGIFNRAVDQFLAASEAGA